MDAFRWVYAYHKNLPTNGTNDTQASESTFRAIKYYTKAEFGNRTVGTGENSYSVFIESVPELHSFLLSPESLKLWSDSQVDHLAIACMFNINVDVFVYNSPIYPPRWERTSPVPLLLERINGSYNDESVSDILLYNCVFTHYDLLIPRK